MPDERFTDAEVLAELRREYHFRQRVYPRQVQNQRMTQAEADYRMAIIMQLICDLDPKPDQGSMF